MKMRMKKAQQTISAQVARLRKKLTREDERRYTAPGAVGFGVLAEAARANIAERAERKATSTPLPKAPAPMTPDELEEEELHGDSPVAQARLRERARCKAIITSEAGQRNPSLSHALAFNTRLGRTEALQMLLLAESCAESEFAHLANIYGGGRGGRAERNAASKSPTAAALAAQWDEVFARQSARTAGRPSH